MGRISKAGLGVIDPSVMSEPLEVGRVDAWPAASTMLLHYLVQYH